MADTNPTLEADRAALVELRELGLDMARLLAARAKADAEDGVDADRTPAFDRISRGVRRAVYMLQQIARAQAAAAKPYRDRVRARRQIIRDLEDVTARSPKPERDAAMAELSERMDGPEFDDEMDGMSIADASRLIRRDFGLGEIFVHKRRTPADIRDLAARAEHSARAAALPEDAAQALAEVLRQEAARHPQPPPEN